MVKHIFWWIFLSIIKSSDVIELTDQSFDELVLQSTDLWIIDFYSPNCGYCKQLDIKWDEAASKTKGKAKFGKVNMLTEKELQERYEVTTYPQIYIFHEGFDYGKGK